MSYSNRLLATGLKAITSLETANFKVIDHGNGWVGIAVKAINGTGVATIKGTVVSASAAMANTFVIQNNEFDSFGIVYEAGVANGSAAWVIIQGVAEVLWKDSQTATKGYVALAADTDGRAINVAVPSANPVVAEHFKEIGHVLEDNGGGVNQLVKCMLHFN